MIRGFFRPMEGLAVRGDRIALHYSGESSDVGRHQLGLFIGNLHVLVNFFFVFLLSVLTGTAGKKGKRKKSRQ